MDWNKVSAIAGVGSFGNASVPIGIYGSLVFGFLFSGISLFLSRKKINPLEPPKPRPMEIIYGLSYLNEAVKIDNKNFDRCKFHNVTLVYDCLGECNFNECNFSGTTMLRTSHYAAKRFTHFRESLRSVLPGDLFVGSVDTKGNFTDIAGRPIPLSPTPPPTDDASK